MSEIDATVLEAVDIKGLANQQNIPYGLIIAFCIMSLWAASLFLIANIDISHLPIWLILLTMLWQTFLYTGLFITAHDAMHGSVFPQNPKINNWVGSLAVSIYGGFSYKELLKNHHYHHRYPASDRDPDFHDGTHKNPVSWYLYFMRRYFSWKQFLGLVVVLNSVRFLFHIPFPNLELFLGIPAILSSIQLFYFGTFLPHHEPDEGYQNPHRAQTNSLPMFLSFITCYHFGYHQEHHEYPHIPWWQLPKIHKLRASS
ncbi:MAG: fatty acid desaturase [Elainellaceae cyanobacterium]